jgi:predicted protein tyrosine phosphatase
MWSLRDRSSFFSIQVIMEFIVHDRQSIESGIVVRTAYILISIRDPDKPPVRVPRPAGLRDVLSLTFHDAEPARGFKLPDHVCLMQATDATSIWEFVQQHRDHVGTIVCHCEQGMSRSPAVALALAEALGGDAASIRAESQPNQYVYEMLRDTIGHQP